MPDISENTPATLDAELSASRTETVAISEADFTESVRMAEEIGKVKSAGHFQRAFPVRHPLVFFHEGIWCLQGKAADSPGR